MTDTQIWNQFKSGDPAAFEKIYRTYFKQLYQYGKKFSMDDTLVEDALQDLFIELWNKRSGLSNTDSIIKYLMVATRRKIIRMVRDRNKLVKSDEIKESDFHVSLSIESSIIRKEKSDAQKKKFKTLFDELTEKQKEILYLRYYADLNFQEIAEIMDINYQSVRNLSSRTLKLIRNRFLFFIFLLSYL